MIDNNSPEVLHQSFVDAVVHNHGSCSAGMGETTGHVSAVPLVSSCWLAGAGMAGWVWGSAQLWGQPQRTPLGVVSELYIQVSVTQFWWCHLGLPRPSVVCGVVWYSVVSTDLVWYPLTWLIVFSRPIHRRTGRRIALALSPRTGSLVWLPSVEPQWYICLWSEVGMEGGCQTGEDQCWRAYGCCYWHI